MLLKLMSTSIFWGCLLACGGESTPEKNIAKEKQSLALAFNFSESAQDFSIDTSDYYIEHPLNAEIISEMATMPSPYEDRQGIMFHWNNYSDDMKGFFKKKITGLRSDSQFQVDFQVNILTFMSENCAGGGGLPGPDVTVKAALLVNEPLKHIVYDNPIPEYRINIDDVQSGGKDVVVLGHIGLPVPCEQEFFTNPRIWEIKPLSNDDDFFITTNSTGEAWIYVSIDSGFEGITTFYLTEVELQIQEL